MVRKILTLFSFFVFIPLLYHTLQGQSTLGREVFPPTVSPATRMFLHDLERDNGSFQPDFKEQYDLVPLEGTYAIGAMLWIQRQQFKASSLKALGVENYRQAGEVISFKIKADKVSQLSSLEGVRMVDIGDPVSPDLEHSIPNVRADSVYAGFGDQGVGYTGKGVVIGVIDWGFDYTHPVFWDTAMQHYRVVRAWDQNKLSGPSPKGYDFGTEYASFEALMEAQQDTIYVFSRNTSGSHGTHVAGIAGGGGGGSPHKGVAFESELILISLRRDAPSLIDAFTYIRDYAEKAGKPFVVNMSFGSHLGPHDGTDLKNVGLDAIAGEGRIFVGSAGNNGTTPFHVKYAFQQPTDTLKTIVNFSPQPEYFGQTLSMWGSANSSFGFRLGIINSLQEVTMTTPFYFSSQNPVTIDTFLYQGDTLLVRITATSSFPTNQKPNIRVEIRKTFANRILLEAVGDAGSELHVWNNVRLLRRFTNWGVTLGGNYPGETRGDVHYGLGEPAGCGKKVITVGSYYAERRVPAGHIAFGQISDFSSRGPTVDERRKPDISGPGHQVISAVNSFDPAPGQVVLNTSFQGKNFPFASYSGTSMSGPTVAGVVALLLEKNPTLHQDEVKKILIDSRRLDQHTGEIGDTGHLVWGHGKVNALQAMLNSQAYPVKKYPAKGEVIVYPNPGGKKIRAIAPDYTQLTIYDITGKQCKTIPLTGSTSPNDIALEELSPGMYVFQFKDQPSSQIQHIKVVIE
jgi:minor extracellular serine protease Vpr